MNTLLLVPTLAALAISLFLLARVLVSRFRNRQKPYGADFSAEDWAAESALNREIYRNGIRRQYPLPPPGPLDGSACPPTEEDTTDWDDLERIYLNPYRDALSFPLAEAEGLNGDGTSRQELLCAIAAGSGGKINVRFLPVRRNGQTDFCVYANGKPVGFAPPEARGHLVDLFSGSEGYFARMTVRSAQANGKYAATVEYYS